MSNHNNSNSNSSANGGKDDLHNHGSPLHFGSLPPPPEEEGGGSMEDLHALLGDWQHDNHNESSVDQHTHTHASVGKILPPSAEVTGKALASIPEAATGGLNVDDSNIPDDDKAQARSERKRSREKQRRNDVNKQFAELTECLKKIELSESSSSSSDAITKKHLLVLNHASSPANRVDLIARTIAHLERLHHSHQTSGERIASLEQQLDAAKKAGEDTAQKLKEAIFSNGIGGGGMQKQVMMMVPMMVPANGQGHGMMTAAMPQMIMPQQQPVIPQPFPNVPPREEQKTASDSMDPHSNNSTPQPTMTMQTAQQPMMMMMAPQTMGMPTMMMMPQQQPMQQQGATNQDANAQQQQQAQQQPMMMPMMQAPSMMYGGNGGVGMHAMQQQQAMDGSLSGSSRSDDASKGGNLAHAA